MIIDRQGNNIYITGYFSATVDFDPGPLTFNLTSAGSSDIFISKLDSGGNFLWAKKAGGNSFEESYSVAIDNFGRAYLAGYFSSDSMFFDNTALLKVDTTMNTTDIFIAKLDTMFTGIAEAENLGTQISLYPNPASNELKIQSRVFGTELKIKEIEIYNVLGEKRLTPNPSPNGEGLRVDVSSLAAGIYFVKLMTENGMATGKFVKQ
jgi:hypothetical protein